MLKRIFALFKKEIRHILRDPRTLAVVFALPTFMVVLFGYALNMDVKHIPIAVVDRDGTPASRELARAFSASSYFDILRHAASADEVEPLLKDGLVRAALVVPRGYQEARATGRSVAVQVLVDGSDPTYGAITVNYASAITYSFTIDTAANASLVPFEVREKFLYNPDLEGADFIIPGIVAVILMMVCALLTSITISREKETGTMDILLVSPVHPREIIIGKVLPYIVLGLLDAVFILVFARLVFHIPLRGNLLLLTGFGVVYIYCALSMGILISSMASTQQVAIMAALVASVLPSIMLSGFIFSIFSMPQPIRILSYLVPARHFMIIIRGILLKANTARTLFDSVGALLVLGTVFLGIATARFKTRRK